MKYLYRLFHRHKPYDLKFIKYLHGDEITYHNGKRFEYECIKCGASIFLFKPITLKEE